MNPSAARACLRSAIAEESAQPVHAAVQALSDAILERHSRGALAVLFYGSALRDRGAPAPDALLDFYLLAESCRAANAGWLAAAANRVLPPNVFYLEVPWRGTTLRAKYAVMSLAQFRRGNSRLSVQAVLWARFAQPVRIVHARDAAARKAVVEALAGAVLTLVRRVVPLLPGRFTARDLWSRAFQETYRSEIRSESSAPRAELIYRSNPQRYDRFAFWGIVATQRPRAEPRPDGPFVLADSWVRRQRATLTWMLRRWIGKLLNLLRLVKACFTFAGALDYVRWKVERHSGVRLEFSPWQSRHPLLAAPILAWRLYRQGAFR